MTTSVGQIDLELGIDYDRFNRELNGIASNAAGMVTGSFTKLGTVIAAAFAIDKLIDFGRESTKLASHLQEVENVVNVTFGSMASDIDSWSQSVLDGFGLSELSAKRYASTLGAMLKSSGLAGEQMKQMSMNMTELAADMASFYNLDHEEAFYKIQSGISGEVEPLRQLGINMTVANMEAYALSQGIRKSYQEMSQAEQTLLRYNYLMEKTSDAQGDFARTSGSWANQIRLLGEQWRIFQSIMGQGFINVLAPVVKWLNLLILKLQTAAKYFKAFTELIFGATKTTEQTAAVASDTSGSLGDMGTSVGEAGKAAKKAGKEVKGSLSSFDQLNVIGQNASEAMGDLAEGASAGLGGAGDVDLGTAATGEIVIDTTALDGMKDKLELVKSVAYTIGQAFQETFGPTLQRASDVAKNIFNGLLDSGKLLFNGLKEAGRPVLEWFSTDGVELFNSFSSGFLTVLNSLFNNSKRIFDLLVSEAVNPALELLSKITVDALDIIKDTWDKWGAGLVQGVTDLFDNIADVFQTAWDVVLGPIWNNMLEALSWLWDKHLKGLVTEVYDFVASLAQAALDIANSFAEPLKETIKAFGPIFAEIFNGIVNILATFLATAIDIAKGVIRSLKGITEFLSGIFTSDWKKAWTGIKDFFGGIADSIGALFKGAINLIIDAVNVLISGLNRIKFDFPDWVPEVGGKQFGISIPKIPKLANGGLVSGPTLAMVGDNRNANIDPEVVSPLSKLQEMMGVTNQPVLEVLYAILNAIESQETTIELDGDKLARSMRSKLDSENARVGKSFVMLGGARA